ncbi:MAG: TonB-dependent receptor plug domain-containing protein [Nostoc sp. ChiSLP01]|nr:AMIN domain-containing protein [Nostoc sp. CmiSLP01]MDZ8283334.1 AMIN domain-containing protein [Nostoc sp. ChiSLP01]
MQITFRRLNWQLSIVTLVIVGSQPAWAVTVTNKECVISKSPVLASCVSKPRHLHSQVGNSVQRENLDRLSKNISQLNEIQLPATSAQMLVQSPTPSIVTITGVKANPTDKGVEIILETPQGEQLQITNRSAGNNFIADIPNAQLQLPSGDTFTFRSQKPIEGISEITVTNFDANTIRVTAIGEAGVPTVELFDSEQGLILGLVPSVTATQPQPQQPANETPQQQPTAQQDEAIELLVTGEQDGYRVQDTTTATKTDTPLRDIPQSIQVIPRQVLEDRKPRTLTEAVETVSGVYSADTNFNAPAGSYVIRGFEQRGNFRNGYRDVNNFALTGIQTIERVEVLKGPASVLFGAVEPGGIINVITKQPLSEPYYNLAFEAGNRGFYQPSLDVSGPLNTDKTLLYRLNTSYQSLNGFQDFVTSNLTAIAPSIS